MSACRSPGVTPGARTCMERVACSRGGRLNRVHEASPTVDAKNRRAYTGRSGQMAIMAELLARGSNVAIPEIDVGQDLFAFLDGQSAVDRLQIKTANARKLRIKDGYS